MGYGHAVPLRLRCGTGLAHRSRPHRLSIPVLALGAGKEALGAGHGSEVAFVFGNPGTGQPPRTFDETDWRISQEMQEYWTNFAKSGDPNGGKLPRWPKFDPAKRAYIDFTNSGPIAKEGLRRQVCELYSQYLEDRLKQ